MEGAQSYPMQLLRSRSYPHYFSVLCAPARARAALAALYAFQHEILHMSLQMKEPLLGEMRLHYWQESLKTALPADKSAAAGQRENGSAGRQSPLIKALCAAAEAHKLPLAPLLQLCKTAALNLGQEVMESRSVFEKYCAEIYGAIIQSACGILAEEGAAEPKALSAACLHGGIAQGCAAILRDLPHYARQGKQPVPQDIVRSLGLDWAHFCRAASEFPQAESNAAELRLRQALAAYFHQHYRAFKQVQKSLPAALRPAFLPLAVLPSFIERAKKQKYSLLRAAPRVSLLSQQGKILRAALFSRF